MAEPKHTLGPWNWDGNCLEGKDGDMVIDAWKGIFIDEDCKALLAASPDMFAALTDLLACVQNPLSTDDDIKKACTVSHEVLIKAIGPDYPKLS